MLVRLPWWLPSLAAGGLVQPRVWESPGGTEVGDEIILWRALDTCLGVSGLCSIGNMEPLRVPTGMFQMVYLQVAAHMACWLHNPKDTLQQPVASSVLLFYSWSTFVIPAPELSLLSHNYCAHHSCFLILPVSRSPCQQSRTGHREPHKRTVS